MKRVRVIPPQQVSLDGTVFGPGETVEVPDDVAASWVNAGWAEAATSKSAPRKAPAKSVGRGK
jgi:hypothetical protein